PVQFHICEAGGRIPSSWQGTFEARLEESFIECLACCKHTCDAHIVAVVDHEKLPLLSFEVPNDARCPVAEAPVGTLRPPPRTLAHMSIGIHDLVGIHDSGLPSRV